MKLHDCFTEFHKRAGREMARQPWKRGGNYLYFYSTEKGERMPGNPDRLSSGRYAAEFSAFHYPHTGEKTKKYFIRVSHNANGLHAQLYCPIDFSYAGGYCDLTFKDDQRKTNTVRLNLADSPVLPSAAKFEELLVAEVNEDYDRSLRGLDGMTYCKVLPNGGCMTTPATEEMKKKRRAQLEKQHPEQLARAKTRAAEFHQVALSLYPLNDQKCAVGTQAD